DDLAGVERHQQALARSLRVPDDADALVAERSLPNARPAELRRAFMQARTVADCGRRDGAQGGGDGRANRMELMIAGEDFDGLTACVAEDDEVLDEVEKAAAIEHALENRLEFRCALGPEAIAVNRPPGHEPLAVGGERADARGDPVR